MRARITDLTPCERRVALLVSEGLSNREIADRLEISVHTVKNYMLRAFDKKGFKNRVAMARWVLLGGLDEVPAP